jgi:predicted ATP-grasp superfamily ATP-dependent carboligase
VRHTITIVGASARAAAFSAVRAGFCVRTADRFADADLRRVADAIQVEDYPSGLDAALAGPVDQPWMYTGALENYPRLIERWQQRRPLWGNSAAVLVRVRDPSLTVPVLTNAGLLVPAFAPSPRQLPLNGSWLCKGLRSAGGTGVRRWTADRAATPWHDCYFQKYVCGTPCAAIYVAARGAAMLLGITRQLVGEPWAGAAEFSYCGSIGPWQVSSAIEDTFQRIGDVLARGFNLVGLFGVDAILNDQGVWPIEINPRYTASVEVLEQANGFRAIELQAETCAHGRLPKHIVRKSATLCGKVVVFAPNKVRVPFDAKAEWLQVDRRTWPNWADIPSLGSRLAARMPLITAFSSANDESQLLKSLREQAMQVRNDARHPSFTDASA